MTWAELIELATGGAGAVVVISAAGAVVIRGVWAFYRWCRRMEDILVYVDQEMRRNGGATMRDAIARIDRRVEKLENERKAA